MKFIDVNEFFKEIETECIKLNDFDDCLIGIANGINLKTSVFVYSADKIVLKLISKGYSDIEAVDYFENNIFNAYFGDGTPIYVIDEIYNENKK